MLPITNCPGNTCCIKSSTPEPLCDGTSKENAASSFILLVTVDTSEIYLYNKPCDSVFSC
ncbi:hypothetical protein CDL15_Pgr001573 [Punica granatum]|uniref:Uncharacterized protein n=1 Tax=Punica granatum TaxID=22663 RepID=A0A218XBB7_PUNGR|nr:hypothetical protein CDL15_Pgr001573 [Punica granatum]